MLVRESGFAIRGSSRRELLVVVRSVLVHVKFYLRCALTCHWCVRVKCSGASDPVARDYKKGLETPLTRAISLS